MSTKTPLRQTQTEKDPRWASVLARDPRADGRFYYSVTTTGVYCRPSCSSRRANPGNVRFHESPADAERAGFRPCKRCRPNEKHRDAHAATIADICRILKRSTSAPSLAALGKRARLSPYHFHRIFKKLTGVTPRAYRAAHRTERVRRELRDRSKSVTEAIYDAGFNSAGRFYETSDRVLGMTPTDYRAGGAATEIQFAVGECSLGSILVAQTRKGVCAILLGDDPDALVRDLQDRFSRATLVGGTKTFERTVARVVAFVEAPSLGLDLPLDVRGTAFQQRVWNALSHIPAGATATYSDIASRIGSPASVRAVAGACAANPIAVAIPCHRVVRRDGSLSGYRWGVERKKALLKKEGA